MGKVINIDGGGGKPSRAKGDHLDEPEIPGKCNAPNRQGKRCRNVAGYGTDHVGYGKCKYHMGSTPAGQVAAHKEAAVEYVRSIAGERSIDPIEAMLWAVRLSAGAVTYWFNLLSQEETSAELALAIEEAYGKERDRLAKTAEMCIRVGLAERQVKIAERQGDLMAQVLEATLEHVLGKDVERINKAKAFAARAMLALPAGQAV